MPADRQVIPRTFYLNEQHELSRGEKEGGGRTPQYYGIDWAFKGNKVASALTSLRERIASSKDPLRDRHYFVLAKPVESIQKRSKSKKALNGLITESVRYNQSDSRAFRRLGVDLLEVTEDGRAIVHLEPERLAQLIATSSRLPNLGPREQARWASVDDFGLIPSELRVDEGWLSELRPRAAADAVIEFQPLLGRLEIDALVRSISALLRSEKKEVLTSLGSDFSGRHWTRGKLTPETLRAIAASYYSVQTLHSPLTSFVVSTKKNRVDKRKEVPQQIPKAQDLSSLPSVAILDTGVPQDHSILGSYRRASYIAPDSYGRPVGDHGSFVASRVVFGDPDSGDGAPSTPTGVCRFYDALVAKSAEDIDDKSVFPAIEAVVATAPDVRVFNLSFDTRRPLDQFDPTKRREHLLLVQDLDNLAFRDDLLVVVSAGNPPSGVRPSNPYPNHYDDPAWQLGAWARSFNSLTCGSYVGNLSPGGLVANVGWPSPFTRVGPGLCETPKPDYSAHGGNSTPAMHGAPGLGVWGLTASAIWEDRSGTSYAAPLLAREAALTLSRLQRSCGSGARPYAVTAKAFLALTCVPHSVTGAAETLASRTLGRGTASHVRLDRPSPNSAVMLWQGVLEGPGDIARVMLPIPLSWYENSGEPKLRVVLNWDPPVNAAVGDLWATRKVALHLKASPDGRSLRGSHRGHRSYPMIDRLYDLRKLPKGESVEGDMWLIELSYEQIADYQAGITFTTQQRVGFAAEIFDTGEDPLGPQAAIQSLPSAETMVRLSVPPQSVKAAVIVSPIR